MSITKTGLAADTTTANGGASLRYSTTADSFDLSIPALSENATLTNGGTVPSLSGTSSGSSTGNVVLDAEPWTYLFGGLWVVSSSTGVTLSEFVGGYQTPGSGLPTSGSATYSANHNVQGYVITKSAGAALVGSGSLTANFATGALTGTLSNMQAFDQSGTPSTWNNVSLTGSLSKNATTFTGTTAVTSAPGGTYGMASSATGTLSGGFFGPNGQEIGAVWTLGDGNAAAAGIVGADMTPFNVATPSTPSAGTSPIAAQLATAGGPTFDNSSGGYASGNFPVTATWMQLSSSGLAAGSNTGSATLSDAGTSTSCTGAATTCTPITLTVPSVGTIQATISGSLVSGSTAKSTSGNYTLLNYGLSYVAFGAWASVDGNFSAADNVGAYMFGYQTPTGSMPTSGTGSYTGTSGVSGMALIPGGGSVTEASVKGDASFTANFSTGSVTGSFTNMKANDGVQTTPWNNVNVSASIATGTSTFSGTTAAGSSPTGPYVLKGAATGTISGGFYGPNAEQIGAVWTLSNGDGTGSAIGTVGAGH